MKKDLVEILACPVCKNPLIRTVNEEKNGDVVSGTLSCQKCRHDYSIKDSIPHLLPPDV